MLTGEGDGVLVTEGDVKDAIAAQRVHFVGTVDILVRIAERHSALSILAVAEGEEVES